ncbi:MAG: organoarsenical effux MFS transporter ArsJ [Pseudohongiellaceae bacterium]|nr:organoarsenical effux MFS transporter ArsJ [Pseudohongiellaceae bacterium]
MVVTASYWAFTLTDGALRMLVVLFFHELGYSPIEVASLFLLYEFFGVITNLFGGWIAARIGLNVTMHIGLSLQILALGMLCVDPSMLSVLYVMVAQALSGIAKDLNKMSAKSSIKTLIPRQESNKLYSWVAKLTGSKNALKGIGFFLGGALLAAYGFRGTLIILLVLLVVVLAASIAMLNSDIGVTNYKPKFADVFSKSAAINYLSAARFFLFSSRDVWFVVALPVFLQSEQQWSYGQVGALMAAWVIMYGAVQVLAPSITGSDVNIRKALFWSVLLLPIPLLIALGISQTLETSTILVIGLLIFGAVFAINSSVHSYLIVAWAREEGVSLDVGFYYMANAGGRLAGTVLSGAIYQVYGFSACLVVSSALILATSLTTQKLVHKAPN